MAIKELPTRADALQFKENFLMHFNPGQKLNLLFLNLKEEQHKIALRSGLPDNNSQFLSPEECEQKIKELRAHLFAAIKSIEGFSHITGIIMPNNRVLTSSGVEIEIETSQSSYVDISDLFDQREAIKPEQAILFAFENFNYLFDMLLSTFEPEQR